MSSSSTPANVALRAGIVACTLATAFIHLSLNFPDPGFIIGGLVYLALLAALYLPLAQLERYRNVLRWVLIGFTALSIFLWVLLGDRTAIGYTAKAIEVALILLLLLDARRSRS
jgi:hypothetical protein